MQQPAGPGNDFFDYVFGNYFDGAIEVCQFGPNTACGEFFHSKLDEWAASYLAAQG